MWFFTVCTFASFGQNILWFDLFVWILGSLQQSFLASESLGTLRYVFSNCRNPILFLDFIYFNFSRQGWEFSKLCKFVHGIAEDIIKARKKTIVSILPIWAASWENQRFAYAKTKTQISFAVAAKLISAFVFATWIVQYRYFLNTKFRASNHLQWLYSLVCVRPGQNPHCWFSLIAAHICSKTT